ncbi:MAG: prepilin-type N-terminal cleavage/methylation domain-containing protein, partial [Candidatus Omnitrophica bacterium]|nr:prepilin-type N-terminal cleavage/methylation domain-containing protein [Candidatus Omnitrophota bacterium]
MKKSFTLIELIVVIAIIAILAAIIAPNAFKAIEKAKISTVISTGQTYKTALLSLYADTGHWPADEMAGNRIIYLCDPSQLPVTTWVGFGATMHPSNLFENDNGWAGWNGPYIENLQYRHPWGGVYILQRTSSLGKESIYMQIHGFCYSGDPNAYDTSCKVPSDAAQ